MDTPEMTSLFEAFGLNELWTHLLPRLSTGIQIKLQPHDHVNVGDSKIGGMPDLPQSIDWPNAHGLPLAFLAQINLSEVHELDIDQRLPESGWLYFFYDAVNEHWGDVPDDYWHFAVRYFDGELSQLQTAEPPKNLAIENHFLSSAVSFYAQTTFPDESSLNWPKDVRLTRKQWMILGDLEEHMYELNSGRYNQLLGHSINLQEGMEPLCSRMSRQFFEEDNVPDDWVLLLQLDSNDKECGMMWGDCGVLYFWIREQDLAQRRFEKCWCVMQCF